MIRYIVDEFNCNHQADVGQNKDSQQLIYTRDKEHKQIYDFLVENMNKKRAGLMYLCGHPGTGKTSSLNMILA
jgi:Cdc6-like AAA superfamily ATPase